ncbi:Armadillo-like helical domain and Armadillo-type fold domain-containing protein [Strongyloides ratti]|uniref:Armadillo-like helical domain and Armadillo-type fold domain-containing protein n=1 Tax=Strongyloides ratti TaxID=34506 RepID=A0A090KST7_STRRB|nr:Armadillo-like helical domain and Armadillo-type fold domain-containing protein [Strongyloides ratti]CEF60565.1 Armadillo-like helical domain and Armadillo-type fold domain-containing protein [Strongyloides ratti]
MPSLLNNFVVTKKGNVSEQKNTMNMKGDDSLLSISKQSPSSNKSNDEMEHLTFNKELIYSTQAYLIDLKENCEMDIQCVLFSRSCFDIDNNNTSNIDNNNISQYSDFIVLDHTNKSKKCIARLTSSLQKVVSTSSTEINNITTNDEKIYDTPNNTILSNDTNINSFETSKDDQYKVSEDSKNSCDFEKITNNKYIYPNIEKFCYTSNYENGPVAILYTSRNDISLFDGKIINGKRLFMGEGYEKKYKKDGRSNQKGYYLRLRSSTPNLSGIVEEEDVEDVETTPFMRSYDNCIHLKNYKNNTRKPVIRGRNSSSDNIKKNKQYEEVPSTKTYHHLIHVNNNINNYSTIDINSGSSFLTDNIQTESYTSSNSPKSIYSTRSSTDSGQESTETDYKKNLNKISLYHYIVKYQQIYAIIDNILKLGSNIYSSLTYIIDNKYICQNLLIESSQLITFLKNRYLINIINNEDINLIEELLIDVEKELIENGENRIFSNYFIIILRRTIEEVFNSFAKIICEYFLTSNNDDELLNIASEHFIYLLLFSDELCNVAIQYQLVKKLLQHCTNPTTNYQTIKLLLRALAILCSASKGCSQLISNNGFNFIINVICYYPFDCSVEAAGVLTQLTTSPLSNCMTLIKSILQIITKLTEMIECCDSAESLLLCTAALSNLSIQYPSANRYIHEIKTCQKLVLATKKPKCCSIFVYEQMVTLMARMVSQGWYLTLYNKDCVTILLNLMLISDELHPKYCERIKYKSAVALSSIAKNDYGLQLIKFNNGYGIMCKITESNLNNTQDPTVIICQTIRDRLENYFSDIREVETEL